MEPARIEARVAVKTGSRAADGALRLMIVRATFFVLRAECGSRPGNTDAALLPREIAGGFD
ncbi:hypothetical protein [Burkholderia sp. LMG 32019]|uniref:hypothetical protein n=1 Tax=Burkholderia sp. LMG 32019 TaxID=3158173 RepID=UPI003C2AAD6C